MTSQVGGSIYPKETTKEIIVLWMLFIWYVCLHEMIIMPSFSNGVSVIKDVAYEELKKGVSIEKVRAMIAA